MAEALKFIFSSPINFLGTTTLILIIGIALDAALSPFGKLRTLVAPGAEEDEEVEIKVKYHGGTERIKFFKQGNWIDLRTQEDVVLKAGEYKRISLGVSMELPEGYEAIIAPRSSTFEKYNIVCTNSIGIIDESYKGDNDIWQFPVYATRDTVIPNNTRICQFRLLKHQPEIRFVEVNHLGNRTRGGFGSTGEK